jgi:chromosome partitioning protein
VDALRFAEYSEKGGVGKTSITNGLAAVAGDRGMRVLVVDLDLRATASVELGLPIPESGDPEIGGPADDEQEAGERPRPTRR